MDVLYAEAAVISDDLEFFEVFDTGRILRKVRLEGHVQCANDVQVRVLKWMDTRRGVREEIEVLTTFYQYHAWRPGHEGRREQSLVRYDQAHGDSPHRHVFDSVGDEVGTEQITLDSMPRLDSVIREALALAAKTG